MDQNVPVDQNVAKWTDLVLVSKARCFTNTDALPPYLKFPRTYVQIRIVGKAMS